MPTALLLGGFLIHSVALASLFFREGFATVAVMGDALLFNSWLMVGIYLLIQLKYPLAVLGGIVAPLAFLMTFRRVRRRRRRRRNSAGIANFLAAAARDPGVSRQRRVCSGVRRERDLSAARAPSQAQKMTALMKRFPSLESLDRLNYRAVGVGLSLDDSRAFSPAVCGRAFIGATIGRGIRGKFLPGIAWLFYGALLHGRITAGLRGKKAALLTMVGFCVVLGYFLWGDAIFPSRHGGRFE